MQKPPLSVRENPEARERYYAYDQAIPAGLRTSLLHWVDDYYWGGHSSDSRERRFRLERVLNDEVPNRRHDFTDALLDNDALLLNVVDIAISEYPGDDHYASQVERMLNEARSSYTIARDEDGYHELQLRQPAELTVIVENAANSASNAAEHLRKAWSRAFKHSDPDPNRQHESSITPPPKSGTHTASTKLGVIQRETAQRSSRFGC